MKGTVIKSVGNLYTIKSEDKIYKCNYRGKNKLTNNFSNPIVSGDEVEFILNEDNNGIIENIIENDVHHWNICEYIEHPCQFIQIRPGHYSRNPQQRIIKDAMKTDANQRISE